MKLLKLLSCSFTLFALSLIVQAQNGNELFRDMNAPQHERILDLLSRLTVEEKISLLLNDAKEISRLNIDKYNHGNEALHGVVRPGEFTVFPQAIGLAAMWNPAMLHEVSSAISDEARGRWKGLWQEAIGWCKRSPYVLVADSKYGPRPSLGTHTGNIW